MGSPAAHADGRQIRGGCLPVAMARRDSCRRGYSRSFRLGIVPGYPEAPAYVRSLVAHLQVARKHALGNRGSEFALVVSLRAADPFLRPISLGGHDRPGRPAFPGL